MLKKTKGSLAPAKPATARKGRAKKAVEPEEEQKSWNQNPKEVLAGGLL